jgi:hypothetical protein
MASLSVRFTESRLYEWSRRWPCSTLVVGTAYFDRQGDLVDLSGKLSRADVDGHEFDAFVDDHQNPDLAKVRGKRCT